ncbi:hypothetical protein RSSM_00613 [Rhodopirellula sallentina SM41]|uniref:Uncharacterized protein n=1 Tax=Rhodopirellula sallentina SM41 TaxID=1263870 RepID=M5UPN8_9BACT|nr:hypothetical protein RSSM_00613 [Rhodopirellula sallentina SM41]
MKWKVSSDFVAIQSGIRPTSFIPVTETFSGGAAMARSLNGLARCRTREKTPV